MSWLILTLTSALFLGLYDVCKKAAVRGNAVIPVLFTTVSIGAAVWLPIGVAVQLDIWHSTHPVFTLHALSRSEHALLFLKSVLVGSSWTCAYLALKHLPLSLAGPIRSTSPLWTIAIATLFLGERPDAWQWSGVLVILVAFYAFSFVGRREGIRFLRDPWVGLMVLAAILASASALYDKYLLQSAAISPALVQAWFSIYLVPALSPLLVWWYVFGGRARSRHERSSSDNLREPAQVRHEPDRFQWRWTIPVITVTLLISDFLYFTAIQQDHALISVISPLRRTSVVVAFGGGILIFRERQMGAKAMCLAMLLLGVFLISQSGR